MPFVMEPAVVAKRKVVRAKRNKVQGADHATAAIPTVIPAQNMSTFNRKAKLYAFPSFDRCDSLLFLPVSMARFLNSGDFSGLRKLMASKIDKNCEVYMTNVKVTSDALIETFEIMNELHPDCVSVVHTTKVIGNEIHADIHYKYTDNLTIRKYLKSKYPDCKELFSVYGGPRASPEIMEEYLQSRPEEERFELAAQLATSENMLIYGRSLMKITFDNHTKRVTKFAGDCAFTGTAAGSL